MSLARTELKRESEITVQSRVAQTLKTKEAEWLEKGKRARDSEIEALKLQLKEAEEEKKKTELERRRQVQCSFAKLFSTDLY